VDLHRTSENALGPPSTYDRHLSHLDKSRELLIWNNLPCFPDSNRFTCFHTMGRLVWLIMSWPTRTRSLTSTSFRLLPFLLLTMPSCPSPSKLTFLSPLSLLPLAPFILLFFFTRGIWMHFLYASASYFLLTPTSHP
jgi:hypothetical protein